MLPVAPAVKGALTPPLKLEKLAVPGVLAVPVLLAPPGRVTYGVFRLGMLVLGMFARGVTC